MTKSTEIAKDIAAVEKKFLRAHPDETTEVREILRNFLCCVLFNGL